MCGIVGYIGQKEKTMNVLLNGLEQLEYRGYDSTGIAYFHKNNVEILKKTGKLNQLKNVVNACDAWSDYCLSDCFACDCSPFILAILLIIFSLPDLLPNDHAMCLEQISIFTKKLFFELNFQTPEMRFVLQVLKLGSFFCTNCYI